MDLRYLMICHKFPVQLCEIVISPPRVDQVSLSVGVLQSFPWHQVLNMCSAAGLCISCPVGPRTEMYSTTDKVGCLDILCAIVRLAGSLIRQLFCVCVCPPLVFSLNSQPPFAIKRSVSLPVFLLSTCQSFVSCTFLKAPVGTRARDCLKIACVV